MITIDSPVRTLEAVTRRKHRPRVLIVGGCDVHLRIDLMRALQNDYILYAAGSEARLQDQFTEAEFTYSYYPLNRGVSPLRDAYSIYTLQWLFRVIRPHIVHTFATKPCVWGRIAASWSGVPVIIGTLPGLGSLYAQRQLRGRLTRAAYQPLQKIASHLSDLTIFQNEADAAELVGAGIVPADRATVVPGSGVRTDVLDPASVSPTARAELRAELGLAPETILVTMVSRVIRSKGVLEFMEAARLVAQRHPHARFLLVGPDDRESMDRLTQDELTRLKQNVIWIGARSDIPAILASSDIFVLPTYYREGIPRVLLEAASMGIPLIASRIPGCDQVVRDGYNGMLTPARDPRALAEATAELISNEELRRRFARASRDLAVEQFDVSVTAARTAALYERLLTRKYAPRTSPGVVTA